MISQAEFLDSHDDRWNSMERDNTCILLVGIVRESGIETEMDTLDVAKVHLSSAQVSHAWQQAKQLCDMIFHRDELTKSYKGYSDAFTKRARIIQSYLLPSFRSLTNVHGSAERECTAVTLES